VSRVCFFISLLRWAEHPAAILRSISVLDKDELHMNQLFKITSVIQLLVILPSNEGHPVKRVTFATEVDHDKTINREKAGKETAHAGI